MFHLFPLPLSSTTSSICPPSAPALLGRSQQCSKRTETHESLHPNQQRKCFCASGLPLLSYTLSVSISSCLRTRLGSFPPLTGGVNILTRLEMPLQNIIKIKTNRSGTTGAGCLHRCEGEYSV